MKTASEYEKELCEPLKKIVDWIVEQRERGEPLGLWGGNDDIAEIWDSFKRIVLEMFFDFAELRALTTPTKPMLEGDGYDDSGNIIYDTWICPCCGDRYEVDYEMHNHCPTCGQAIDWQEIDQNTEVNSDTTETGERSNFDEQMH